MKSLRILLFLTFVLIICGGLILVKTKAKKFKAYYVDNSKFMVLSGKNGKFNILKNGNNNEIIFDTLKKPWSVNFCQNMFFINKDLVCLSLGKYIYIYDIETKKIIKEFQIESNNISAKKNNNGDLVVFSGGNIYEYIYAENQLIKLTNEIIPNYSKSTNYPSPYIHPNKIAYSKNRDSVFYAAYSDGKSITAIYEISLKDRKVTQRAMGFCPQVDDAKNCVYFINNSKDSIIKLDFENLQESLLMKYPAPLRDFVVIDESKIFFIHASEKANIKDVRFDTFKILDEGEIKSIHSKGIIYGTPFDVIEGD
mgnify:CR=1 FL=1